MFAENIVPGVALASTDCRVSQSIIPFGIGVGVVHRDVDGHVRHLHIECRASIAPVYVDQVLGARCFDLLLSFEKAVLCGPLGAFSALLVV